MALKNKTKEKTAIYIADLADYNSGYLTGEWFYIDDATTVHDIQNAIREILSKGECEESEHEEYAIHDYNNIPLDSEYPDLQIVIDVANLVRKYSYLVVAVYLNHFDESEINKFEERFQGIYKSKEEFIEELHGGELGVLPDFIRGCIDMEKLFDEIEISGDIEFQRIEEGLVIFNHQ